ncbi:MAG: HpaII family restriction endonuclease [Ignavibacteriales bacterium]|nr:HpaII family restriction endonuclease [Ignavibacteriales bacterium]
MAEYNKGEWSELYVFFKLLSEGKLHAANSDLQQIPELFYPILSIIRKEGGETLEYHRDSNIRVVIEGRSEPIVVFSIAEFFDIARSLLASIREGEGNFSIPWLSEWLETLKIVSITSNSRYKSDITVKV